MRDLVLLLVVVCWSACTIDRVSAFSMSNRKSAFCPMNRASKVACQMVAGGIKWDEDGFPDCFNEDGNSESGKYRMSYDEFCSYKERYDALKRKSEEFFQTEPGKKWLLNLVGKEDNDSDGISRSELQSYLYPKNEVNAPSTNGNQKRPVTFSRVTHKHAESGYKPIMPSFDVNDGNEREE